MVRGYNFGLAKPIGKLSLSLSSSLEEENYASITCSKIMFYGWLEIIIFVILGISVSENVINFYFALKLKITLSFVV